MNRSTAYYTLSTRLRDLIDDNQYLLPALSRFGIPLGFGDASVADVCRRYGVDAPTFVAVANFLAGRTVKHENVSVGALCSYLKNAHDYFLDYCLPDIRHRIIEAVSSAASASLIAAILRFYDEYAEEVRRHMNYENEVVFAYVDSLLSGCTAGDFSIDEFEDNHGSIAGKLNELKDLLVCHFTADTANTDRLNSVLFDIITCERDMTDHCRVENELFVPAVRRLEKHDSTPPEADDSASESGLDTNGDVILTARERDIIAMVARGLSNKEIADRLCLSVHTVATHRRNISAKLDIHSSSGITVYAIMHGIINLQ